MSEQLHIIAEDESGTMSGNLKSGAKGVDGDNVRPISRGMCDRGQGRKEDV